MSKIMIWETSVEIKMFISTTGEESKLKIEFFSLNEGKTRDS